jgi:transcriptional regulator with XRE-family HTH domain
MTEGLQQIAARIRDLREIAGLSQETVAVELGLEPEIYLRYESGEEDLPVSVLYKLAERFHVELGTLLTGEEPRLHSYCLVRKGKGVSVGRRSMYGYQSLAYNFSHKQAEPFLVTVEPGDGSVHLNSHPGQEFNYLLEGTLGLVIDGHELVLEAGDSVYFDSNLPHGMKAVGDTPARFLAIIL